MPEDIHRVDVQDGGAVSAVSVLPMLAGAAVYEGIPIVTRQLRDAPSHLAQLVASGKTIKADTGTELQRLAEFTRAEVKAIQNFARESGVKVPIVAGIDPSLRKKNIGYFLDPDLLSERIKRIVQRLLGKKITTAPTHVGLARGSVPHALHEVAHATPVLESHRLRRVLHDVGGLMGHRLPGTLSRYALLGNVLVPPGEDASSARQFAYKHAPELAGATFLPELIEEGRASGRAIAGARRQGLGTLKTIKELAPTFGTYAAAAVVPILATLIAKNLVKALHSRSEEKMAAAKPGTEIKAPGLLRVGASAAWRIGGSTPPKPKSIKPNSRLGARARVRAPAKPPSNRAYHKDLLKTLYNPSGGSRITVQG